MNNLVFQLVEVTVTDKLYQDFSDSHISTGQEFLENIDDNFNAPNDFPVVLIFGRTQDKKDVLVKVNGYLPYLDYISDESPKRLTSILSEKILKKGQNDWFYQKDNVQRFQRKKLFGWYPSDNDINEVKVFNIIRLFFPSLHARSKAKYISIPGYEVAEQKVRPEKQFTDMYKILESGWISCNYKKECGKKISHCSIEFFTTIAEIQQVECDNIAPLLVCSFDIECSSDTGGFPDAKIDRVVMVSLNYWYLGDDDNIIKRYILCLDSCDNIDGIDIHCYVNEEELLDNIRDNIVQQSPDIMLGYNIFGFDWKFMCDRASLLGCQRFFYQSKIICEKCEHAELKLSSSALGDNSMYILHRTGAISHDIFVSIKTEHKLSFYSLDSVSEHFLNLHKEDLPYKEVFAAWYCDGTSANRKKVAIYCSKDSDLPIKLANHLKSYISLVEMSRVTHTQIKDLLLRGQQIKVYQQTMHFSHNMGYIMNTPPLEYSETIGEFKGATVVDPKIGFYEQPIAVLDFMSLYPSIMMWKNLCFCTYIIDQDIKKREGVLYDDYEFCRKDGTTYTHSFARNTSGVLPKVLEFLTNERKKTKKKMKNATSKIEYDILDKRQLAIKVSGNSVYGFTGADTGMYKLKAIAETVTHVGRYLIDTTIHLSETLDSTEVIYGDTDSVMLRFTDNPSRSEVFERAPILADKITEHFSNNGKKVIILEFEKVMQPYLLIEKKRYCALSYEEEDKPPKMDQKGLPTVRRDNTPIARRVLGDVLNGLMEYGKIAKAEENLKLHLDNLQNNEFKFEDYIQSRSLKHIEDYSNPEGLPQVRTVANMNKRNPGSGYKSGDRVPFVIIEGKSKKIADRAEEPMYARQQGLKVDRLYILENQIEKIINKIFGRIGGTTHIKLITDCRNKLMMQRSNQSSIHSFITTETQHKTPGNSTTIPKPQQTAGIKISQSSLLAFFDNPDTDKPSSEQATQNVHMKIGMNLKRAKEEDSRRQNRRSKR